MEAAEFFGNNNFDFIIDMNILQMGDMIQSNAKGKTIFSFRIPLRKNTLIFRKKLTKYYEFCYSHVYSCFDNIFLCYGQSMSFML